MDVVVLVFLPCLQRMKYVARQLALSLHLFTSARDKNSTVLPGQTFLRRCELDADGKGKHIECLGFLHRYLRVCLHSMRGIRYMIYKNLMIWYYCIYLLYITFLWILNMPMWGYAVRRWIWLGDCLPLVIHVDQNQTMGLWLMSVGPVCFAGL